ncbi:hypothetical protein [Streptomyces sp. NBC_01361]|uniref:hypothetical protein n=1 Tax=Streptomyces sp. NBC_01361 TaxID=2903838 RepID=UPI002E358022|nr:hypothetical protein [Streptomyces sp. NBC_01361]
MPRPECHNDLRTRLGTDPSTGTLCGAAGMNSVQGTFFTELFGARLRYSALGIASQACALVAGFVPAIATALVVAAGSSWPIAALLMVVGLCLVHLGSTPSGTRHLDVAEIEVQPSPASVTTRTDGSLL